VEPAKPAEREEAEIESESSDSQQEQGRNGDCLYFGWDFTPLLPYLLSCSTVLGGTGMFVIQVPLLATNTFIPQVWIMATFATLYAITFGCMSYAAFVDPGQVPGDGDSFDVEKGMPLRAHKSWQYPQPVRRYDHFCRWINTTIGLHNHREFVIMVGTLLLIAFLGMGIDLVLLSSFLGTIASQSFAPHDIFSMVLVALHLGYSFALLKLGGPILRIHVGLISRNELAQEWKKNTHYVANTSMGDNVPVRDIHDVDEYNELFAKDAFVYDGTKNPFDRGTWRNCLVFWCAPRWTADATGEF